MITWTVEDVMAKKPCYTLEQVQNLWNGRNRLNAMEIAALDISGEDRIWALSRMAPLDLWRTTLRNKCAIKNSYADSYAHAHTYTDAHAYARAYAHSHAHSYARAYAHAYAFVINAIAESIMEIEE